VSKKERTPKNRELKKGGMLMKIVNIPNKSEGELPLRFWKKRGVAFRKRNLMVTSPMTVCRARLQPAKKEKSLG